MAYEPNNLYEVLYAVYDPNGALSATTPSSAYAILKSVYEPDGTGKGKLRINYQGSGGTGTDTYVTSGVLTGTDLVLTKNGGPAIPNIDLSALSGGTGTVTGAENGLYLDTDTIKQGGKLTEETTIDLTGNTYTIKDEGVSNDFSAAEGIVMSTDDTVSTSTLHLNATDLTLTCTGGTGNERVVINGITKVNNLGTGAAVTQLAINADNEIVDATNTFNIASQLLDHKMFGFMDRFTHFNVTQNPKVLKLNGVGANNKVNYDPTTGEIDFDDSGMMHMELGLYCDANSPAEKLWVWTEKYNHTTSTWSKVSKSERYVEFTHLTEGMKQINSIFNVQDGETYRIMIASEGSTLKLKSFHHNVGPYHLTTPSVDLKITQIN